MHTRLSLLALLALPITSSADEPRPLRWNAAVETYWTWNFAEPSNRITHFRGFDNRHQSFTLSNAMLDVIAENEALTAHIGLQIGHTPNTYYLAEPTIPATAGAGESDRITWRWLQQANFGWRPDRNGTHGWLVEAGLFLSPIGPEGIAVRDNWNFSRSNLFFALPFYHTGARVSVAAGSSLRLVGAAYNGWNCVTDDNAHTSLSTQLQIASSRLTGSVLYFGGVERPDGALEGEPWRHLFDAWAQWNAPERLTLLAHGDVGFERTAFGTADWGAAAAYSRYRLHEKVHLTARGDVFREALGRNAGGVSSPVFWGTAASDDVARVASATVTFDYRPEPQLSLRAEFRYDDANVNLFFDDPVALGLPAGSPDACIQRTATLGAVVSF